MFLLFEIVLWVLGYFAAGIVLDYAMDRTGFKELANDGPPTGLMVPLWPLITIIAFIAVFINNGDRIKTKIYSTLDTFFKDVLGL